MTMEEQRSDDRKFSYNLVEKANIYITVQQPFTFTQFAVEG
jgi:hypothetical protein